MPQFDNPDFLIIGAGAGGSTAARVLTERGFTVTIFERGGPSNAEDFIPLDELHFLDHKALIPLKEDDPQLYVDTAKPDAQPQEQERWWITNMVGGSTNQWEANLPRYVDSDMAVTRYLDGPVAGADMINWP